MTNYPPLFNKTPDQLDRLLLRAITVAAAETAASTAPGYETPNHARYSGGEPQRRPSRYRSRSEASASKLMSGVVWVITLRHQLAEVGSDAARTG
jgi:hypothetical protein